jgi:hypothetical protein
MSHGDRVESLPPEFTAVAPSANAPLAAVVDESRHWAPSSLAAAQALETKEIVQLRSNTRVKKTPRESLPGASGLDPCGSRRQSAHHLFTLMIVMGMPVLPE